MTALPTLAIVQTPKTESPLAQISRLYWAGFEDHNSDSRRDINNPEHVLSVGIGPAYVHRRDEWLHRVLREAVNTDAILAVLMAVAVSGRASAELAGEIATLRMEETRFETVSAADAALEAIGVDVPGLVSAAVAAR